MRFAIDCEMVQNHRNEAMLARVSLVDEHLRTVMDQYVQPTERVTDYRTWITGIEEGYERHAKPKQEVIRALQNTINGNTLIGFDIEKDLAALGIRHTNVKDVATYPPLMKNGQKQSLKELALKVAGLSIQNGVHDSVEDAKATMAIYNKYRF